MHIASLKNPYVKTLGIVALGFATTGVAKGLFYAFNNRQFLRKDFIGLFSANNESLEDLRVYKKVTPTQTKVSVLLGVIATLGCAAYVTGLAADLAGRVSAIRY